MYLLIQLEVPDNLLCTMYSEFDNVKIRCVGYRFFHSSILNLSRIIRYQTISLKLKI